MGKVSHNSDRGSAFTRNGLSAAAAWQAPQDRGMTRHAAIEKWLAARHCGRALRGDRRRAHAIATAHRLPCFRVAPARGRVARAASGHAHVVVAIVEVVDLASFKSSHCPMPNPVAHPIVQARLAGPAADGCLCRTCAPRHGARCGCADDHHRRRTGWEGLMESSRGDPPQDLRPKSRVSLVLARTFASRLLPNCIEKATSRRSPACDAGTVFLPAASNLAASAPALAIEQVPSMQSNRWIAGSRERLR